METAASMHLVPHTAQKIDIYIKALTLVLKMQRPSVALIQRHLHLGYSDALGVMAALVEMRVVSKLKGKNGYRKVLWKRDRVAMFLSENAVTK